MHNDFNSRWGKRQDNFDKQFSLLSKLFWVLFVVAIAVIVATWIGGGYLIIRILSYFGIL